MLVQKIVSQQCQLAPSSTGSKFYFDAKLLKYSAKILRIRRENSIILVNRRKVHRLEVNI